MAPSDSMIILLVVFLIELQFASMRSTNAKKKVRTKYLRIDSIVLRHDKGTMVLIVL